MDQDDLKKTNDPVGGSTPKTTDTSIKDGVAALPPLPEAEDETFAPPPPPPATENLPPLPGDPSLDGQMTPEIKNDGDKKDVPPSTESDPVEQKRETSEQATDGISDSKDNSGEVKQTRKKRISKKTIAGGLVALLLVVGVPLVALNIGRFSGDERSRASYFEDRDLTFQPENNQVNTQSNNPASQDKGSGASGKVAPSSNSTEESNDDFDSYDLPKAADPLYDKVLPKTVKKLDDDTPEPKKVLPKTVKKLDDDTPEPKKVLPKTVSKLGSNTPDPKKMANSTSTEPECYQCLDGKCVAWNPLAEYPGACGGASTIRSTEPECYQCSSCKCVAWNPLAENPGDGACACGSGSDIPPTGGGGGGGSDDDGGGDDPVSAGICVEVRIYTLQDGVWTITPVAQIGQFAGVGDKIRLAVRGNSSTFSKGRFKVNSDTWVATTNKNAAGEFYVEYTLSEARTYNVIGQVW
jgi:hypothetical protein